jgi:hypothetical protein
LAKLNNSAAVGPKIKVSYRSLPTVVSVVLFGADHTVQVTLVLDLWSLRNDLQEEQVQVAAVSQDSPRHEFHDFFRYQSDDQSLSQHRTGCGNRYVGIRAGRRRLLF